MEPNFDSIEFINHLARQLIENFDFARKATTSVLVGNSRENEVRKKFESVLPPVMGVGSGCVIDSYCGCSSQTDIVIFEKYISQKFSVNNTPDATYFPCEGVASVGEVKSILGKSELEDSFKKIKSVKLLKRYFEPSKNGLSGPSVCFRTYGSIGSFQGTPEESYDQINKISDQIFAFILCGELSIKPDTLLGHINNLCIIEQENLLPNILVSLKDGICAFLNKDSNSVSMSKKGSTGIYFVDHPKGNFQYLLHTLYKVIISGRTVERIPTNRYIFRDPNLPCSGIYKKFTT